MRLVVMFTGSATNFKSYKQSHKIICKYIFLYGIDILRRKISVTAQN